MKVGIVGGGIVGRLMAWHLCQMPLAVHMFDVTHEKVTCTLASGAMVSPFTEIAVLGKAWLDKALLALTWWPQILKSLSTQVYYRQSGTALVTNTEHAGLLEHYLAAIQKLAPQIVLPAFIRTTKQIACHIHPEAHLNPRELLPALGDFALSHGVQWHDEVVQNVAPFTLATKAKQWHFDCVIDCRGLGAQNENNQLRGVSGEALLLKAKQIDLQHAVRFLHPHYGCYIVPQGKSQYVIGATALESEQSHAIYVKSAMSLLTGALLVEPRFKDAEILATFVGQRPTTPSHAPFVKSEPGRFQLNGFFRHGFLLAPALVAEVAEHFKKVI